MQLQIIVVALFALNLLLVWKWPTCRGLGAVIFLVLPLLTVFLPQPCFELDYFWWRIAGAALIAAGTGLMVWVKQTTGRTLLDLGRTSNEIVTAGPYSYLRHPVYLAVVFIQVGWWWVWAGVYSFYFGMFIVALIWLHGYFEEKWLMAPKFGQQFSEYKKTTGMFWVK